MAANCSTKVWDAFLEKIVPDKDFREYLYRVFGYGLTAVIIEHAMFFLHGDGSNGKSTFIEAISGVMGDYAITSPMETFMATQHPEHSTELAQLRGARLVTVSETEEGRNWAESRIKQLTGGDRVSARFMRENFFEFYPLFKLAFYGNHKPKLRSSINVAIKRRMNMLPFTVTITAAEKDEKLGEKLKEERPGILHKLIQGCLQWQQMKGLKPPKVVTDATEEYLANEDKIAPWLEDRCECGDDFYEKRVNLYASWSEWMKVMGEDPAPAHAFFIMLEAKGYKHGKGGDRKFKGLRLKQSKPASNASSPPNDDVPPVGDPVEDEPEIPY